MVKSLDEMKETRKAKTKQKMKKKKTNETG